MTTLSAQPTSAPQRRPESPAGGRPRVAAVLGERAQRPLAAALRWAAREAIPRPVPLWLCLLVVTLAWDRAVYLRLSPASQAAKHALEGGPLFRLAWVLGRMEIWLMVAAAFILVDWAAADVQRVRRGLRRGTLLLLCAGGSGLIAEVFKHLVRRQRPMEADGFWRFDWPPAVSFLDGNNLGFVSSHAATAFGAAFALAAMFPAAMPVFVLAAIGCGLSRIFVGAHFLSDVYLGFLLAYAASRLFYAWDLRNNAGRPIGAAPATP